MSSGAFIAAGLANGITPRDMHAMFIESETADDPFEPEMLLRPAFGEYRAPPRQPAGAVCWRAPAPMSRGRRSRGFFESLPAAGARAADGPVRQCRRRRLSARGCYRRRAAATIFANSSRKLFIVATDLDAGEAVAFGAPGLDDVPISERSRPAPRCPGCSRRSRSTAAIMSTAR